MSGSIMRMYGWSVVPRPSVGAAQAGVTLAVVKMALPPVTLAARLEAPLSSKNVTKNVAVEPVSSLLGLKPETPPILPA